MRRHTFVLIPFRSQPTPAARTVRATNSSYSMSSFAVKVESESMRRSAASLKSRIDRW